MKQGEFGTAMGVFGSLWDIGPCNRALYCRGIDRRFLLSHSVSDYALIDTHLTGDLYPRDQDARHRPNNFYVELACKAQKIERLEEPKPFSSAEWLIIPLLRCWFPV